MRMVPGFKFVLARAISIQISNANSMLRYSAPGPTHFEELRSSTPCTRSYLEQSNNPPSRSATSLPLFGRFANRNCEVGCSS